MSKCTKERDTGLCHDAKEGQRCVESCQSLASPATGNNPHEGRMVKCRIRKTEKCAPLVMLMGVFDVTSTPLEACGQVCVMQTPSDFETVMNFGLP